MISVEDTLRLADEGALSGRRDENVSHAPLRLVCFA